MSLRIAWAGPWNERSAIAAFGVDIVGALAAAGHAVEVFRTEALEGVALPPLPAPGPVHPPGRFLPKLAAGAYDLVAVNLGNHYPYHGAALPLLLATPAVAILHDSSMDGFRHGWAHAHCPVDQRYAPYLGPAAAGADTILARLAALATGAVVHAGHYRAQIEAVCPGPVAVMPLAMTFRRLCQDLAPPRLGNDRLVIATIGHVNPNKRADQVIRAIGASPRLREKARYLLIGPIEPRQRDLLTALARRVGAAAPEFTGQVSDDVLRTLLGGVDAVCCLRDPVLEGGSASLILALRAGRPTLVSNHGAYAEVPDGVVLKCPPGCEAAHVLHHLETILEDPPAGRAMGERARAYAAATYAPEPYAAGLVALAGRVARAAPAILARRRVADALRSLGLPSDPVAMQTAMRGLSALLGGCGKELHDGVETGQGIENRAGTG